MVSYKLCECLFYYHCIQVFQLMDMLLFCLTTKALKGNSFQKVEYSIKYISFETIEELEFLDLVWLVTCFLRHTWVSLLVAIAWVNENYQLYYKAILGTSGDYEFGIQDKQRRKIGGNCGQKTILGFSFEIFWWNLVWN